MVSLRVCLFVEWDKSQSRTWHFRAPSQAQNVSEMYRVSQQLLQFVEMPHNLFIYFQSKF